MQVEQAAGDVVSIVKNVSSNPLMVGIGAVVVGALFFFLWRFIKPWLQKVQDAKNQQEAQQGSTKADHDNQDLNDQADQVLK